MKTKKNNLYWLLLTVLSFSLALASCGGGGGSNPTAPSTGITTGAITLSTDIPLAGDQFTLTVALANETDLRQASLELSYNHTIIEMSSVANGGALVDFEVIAFDDGVGGTNNLLIAYANLASPTYTGSGTLCTITFDTKIPGDTTISFNNSDTMYYYGDGSTKTPLLSAQSISVQ